MAKGEFSCRDLQPKNGKASYLPIYGEKRPERYMALSEVDPKCPFHTRGSRFSISRRLGLRLAASAGISGTLFHDLRRTAVTNMIEAGLSEKERWRSAATRRAPCSIVITIVRENG
jgi:hypothetical protein